MPTTTNMSAIIILLCLVITSSLTTSIPVQEDELGSGLLDTEMGTAADVNDTSEISVKADVPYSPYYLHNYTSIYDEEDSLEDENGTKRKSNKEIIRQDYDFTSWETAAHDGDSHGVYHGVHLVSWRWEDYSDPIMICLTILVAGIFKLLFHHAHFLSKNVPESCVLIVIGILIGVLVYYGVESHSHHFPQFTSTLFFNVLLPPIILDSAYTLYDRDFLANLGSVILFAVAGTLFNVFVIGYGLYGLASMGWMGTFSRHLDSTEALIFSSLISAVDPVAVLAIFHEIGVNMGLYFLVFGESLLNDGVTVVLYNTMVALQMQSSIAVSQYIIAFFSFFTVCFGGLTIGILVGCITAFFLKFTKETRVIEPLVIYVLSYLSFLLAETVHWSGIISLIACGIVQKRYAFPNISKKSYTTVKYAVKTMSALSDCIIFLFLGVVTISHRHEWHTGFALWTIVLCTVTRFIGVFFLSSIINRRRIKKISLREQFILSYGGLRGAVGFSLVTILDEENPFKDIFLTTTLFVIFFTVFIQGSSIKFVVSKLKIQKKTTEAKLLSHDVNEKMIDFVMAGVASVVGTMSRHTVLEAIVQFDSNYVKRWLIADRAVDKLALRMQKISLAEHYARLYGPAVLVHQNKVDAILGDGEPISPMKPDDATKDDERSSLGRTSSINRKMSDDINWNRKTLRMAFSGNPYERYKSKNFGSDSEEHVEKQLQLQRDKWHFAISQLAKETLNSTDNLDEETKTSNLTGDGARGDEAEASESSSLLSPAEIAAAERIRRVYERTKMKRRLQSD